MLAPFLLLLPLASSRPLVEQLVSTDSATRARAAFALARLHDQSDGPGRGAVEDLLAPGTEIETRIAAVRGLFSRGWKNEGGMPAALESKLTALLADPDDRIRAVAVEGIMLLPREKALAYLRKEEPQAIARAGAVGDLRSSPFGALSQPEGVSATTLAHWRIVLALFMLDDRESAPVIRAEVHRRTVSLASRVGCLVDDWSDDLSVLVWLGEDVSPVVSQCGRDGLQPTLAQSNTLLRLDAVHSEAATPALAQRMRDVQDPASRRLLLRWLEELPPTVRPETWPAIEAAIADPDLMVHDEAVRLVSAYALSRGTGAATGALALALTSLDPYGRMEALCGLCDLAQAGDAAARSVLLSARKEERDPAIRAALDLAAERMGAKQPTP